MQAKRNPIQFNALMHSDTLYPDVREHYESQLYRARFQQMKRTVLRRN